MELLISNDEALPKDKDTTSSSLADVNKAKFTTLDAFDSKWYVYATRRIMAFYKCSIKTPFEFKVQFCAHSLTFRSFSLTFYLNSCSLADFNYSRK